MKFIGISYEPRRIIGVVPDFDDENIIPSPGDDRLSADRPGRLARPSLRASKTGSLFACSRHQPHHSRDVADQPVERASTLEDVRAEVLTPDRLNAIVFGGFAALSRS